jgi:chromate reductase
MPRYKVGYFVGTLSSTSINRLLSGVPIRVAPQELESAELGRYRRLEERQTRRS